MRISLVSFIVQYYYFYNDISYIGDIGFLQKGGEGTLDNNSIINARTLSQAEVKI